MFKGRNNKKGFITMILIMVIMLIGVIGLAYWRVANAN